MPHWTFWLALGLFLWSAFAFLFACRISGLIGPLFSDGGEALESSGTTGGGKTSA